MIIDSRIRTEVFDLPLWSAPFGLELLEAIDYTHKNLILDIGVGDGFPTLELSQRFGGNTTIIGVDINENILRRLNIQIQEYGIENVKLMHANAELLPFEDNTIDLVVSNNGINNVGDKKQSILECHRVLKSGAEFVFTYNLDSTFKSFYEVFESILQRLSLSNEVRLLKDHIKEKRPALDLMENYLITCGFHVLSITNQSFSLKFTNGTAFLNHYWIKKYFMPEWMIILNVEYQSQVFEMIEKELNIKSETTQLSFEVPFVCVKCRKI